MDSAQSKNAIEPKAQTSMNAIITGSSRGLGLALAKGLAAKGHNIGVTSRKADQLESLVSSLKSEYPNVDVQGFVLDLSTQESANRFCDEVFMRWQKVDILINNAGMYQEDKITDDIAGSLEKILDVNLMGAVRVGKKFIDAMVDQQSGFVINIISIAANDLRHDAATYSISKLALKGYTDMLREKIKKHGVKVVGIYPGPMDTSSWDDDNPIREKMIQMRDMQAVLHNILNLSSNATVTDIELNLLEDL